MPNFVNWSVTYRTCNEDIARIGQPLTKGGLDATPNPADKTRLPGSDVPHHVKSTVPDRHVIAIWAFEGTYHDISADNAVRFPALKPFPNRRNTIPVHLPATLG